MRKQYWCEHIEKSSKYTIISYEINERPVLLRVQTWICPECGVHGAESEIVSPESQGRQHLRRG